MNARPWQPVRANCVVELAPSPSGLWKPGEDWWQCIVIGLPPHNQRREYRVKAGSEREAAQGAIGRFEAEMTGNPVIRNAIVHQLKAADES